MHCKLIVAVGIILAGLSSLAGAQPDDLDWIDFETVDAGKVVLQTTKVDKGTVHIDLAIAIDAHWQAIWDVIMACEISPEYVPHVIACQQVASIEDCDCELFEQTVKPAFFLPKFEHIFRLEHFPPDRIIVSHVSGPIDRMEGAWLLIHRPGEPIVLVNSLTLKPGFPVPPLFVRNTLKRDLPKVLREIRDRAESAGTN